MNMCVWGRLETRNPTFDVAKALMMLWVIWGHLGLYNVVSPETSVYMLNAKIGVNMPVFFVIGGFLAASTFAAADWGKLLARTISFVWPQVFAAILCGVVITLAGGRGAFSWVMGMWFLRTYAVIYILTAIIFRFSDTDGKRWALFIILYAAMLFCPSRFRIDRFAQVIHMFPYFVFGLMVLKKKVLYLDWRTSCLCGAAYLLTVFLQGDSNVNGMNFWKVNAHWKVVISSCHECITFFARTAVGISGSVFVLYVINSAIGAVPWLVKLSTFGTTSLGIYVIHEYPLCLLGRHCQILPLPGWSRWLVAIGLFYLCHGIIVVVKHYAFTRLTFFGDEKLLADGLRRLGIK